MLSHHIVSKLLLLLQLAHVRTEGNFRSFIFFIYLSVVLCKAITFIVRVCML